MVWEPTTTTRTRRIVGGLVLACALAVMASADVVVVKPEICNHVTWTDWEYWEFSCFNW